MKLTEYNKIISANWKMNGSYSLVNKFLGYFSKNFNKINNSRGIIFCPPFPYLSFFTEITSKFSNFYIGGQDCSIKDNSSRTGEISSKILKDVGCEFVILGHSERRMLNNETDKIVSQKVSRSLENDLKVIVCVGESEKEKNDSKTFDIIKSQLENSLIDICSPENTIIAYEPIWAIGSGKLPSLNEIENIFFEIHKIMDNKFKNANKNKFKILYGGSVNPKNSNSILTSSNIDGVLVGGSSLIIEDFYNIVNFD